MTSLPITTNKQLDCFYSRIIPHWRWSLLTTVTSQYPISRLPFLSCTFPFLYYLLDNKRNVHTWDNLPSGCPQGCDDEEVADFYGRDPNLVKCTDNLEEPLDCRKTKSVLAMFRKMEMQEEEDDRGTFSIFV